MVEGDEGIDEGNEVGNEVGEEGELLPGVFTGLLLPELGIIYAIMLNKQIPIICDDN